MLFQSFLRCKFRNFVRRNADLTASVQQNSLKSVVPQQDSKASLVNPGSFRGFPRSSAQCVRTLCLRFLQHVLNSCLDPGGTRFMVRSCRHRHNLKLASQRESTAAWLCAMGSVSPPHAWVPQAAQLARVLQHHHSSSIAPRKEWCASLLPNRNCSLPSWWFGNFPGHQEVQVQGCGSRGRSGLQFSAAATALTQREKQDQCPDSLFHRRPKVFPSVQNCR